MVVDQKPKNCALHGVSFDYDQLSGDVYAMWDANQGQFKIMVPLTSVGSANSPKTTSTTSQRSQTTIKTSVERTQSSPTATSLRVTTEAQRETQTIVTTRSGLLPETLQTGLKTSPTTTDQVITTIQVEETQTSSTTTSSLSPGAKAGISIGVVVIIVCIGVIVVLILKLRRKRTQLAKVLGQHHMEASKEAQIAKEKPLLRAQNTNMDSSSPQELDGAVIAAELPSFSTVYELPGSQVIAELDGSIARQQNSCM